MKPISIIKRLNESLTFDKVKELPDWIIEGILDNGKVKVWYCEECDKYYDEPKTKRTNMEMHYGVASLFPDSHYEDLLMCPICEGGLEEITIDDYDLTEAILDDYNIYEKVYERFEEEHPDIVGEIYRKEGTHHCDIFQDNMDYAWETIKEMIGEGLLK